MCIYIIYVYMFVCMYMYKYVCIYIYSMYIQQSGTRILPAKRDTTTEVRTFCMDRQEIGAGVPLGLVAKTGSCAQQQSEPPDSSPCTSQRLRIHWLRTWVLTWL